MKDKITSKKIRVSPVVLLILFNLTSAEGLRGNTGGEFYSVDTNQIPNVLTMISKEVRSNYQRIKTWQSETEFRLDTIYKGAKAERIFNTRTDGTGKTPNTVIQHIEGKRQFAVDLEKDFLYTNLTRENPAYYMDFETGRDLGTKSAPSQQVSIVAPEYYINWGPQAMRDGVITNRKAVKQLRQKALTCTNLLPPVSDPRECFVVGGQTIWETFPPVLQYIKEHGEFSVDGHPLKVEECIDGAITKYRVLLPGRVSPGQYLFITMVFSGEKGFNIVSYELTDPNGKVFQQLTWDYQLVSGVHLPKKTTEQILDRKSGDLRYESIYTYNNLKVNQPIPPETFTYRNLGLKDGDKFIDKILQKEYRYQDGQLFPVSPESSDMFRHILPYAAELNVNGDCCVDFRDIVILAGRWLQAG